MLLSISSCSILFTFSKNDVYLRNFIGSLQIGCFFYLQAAAVTNSTEEKLALGPLSSKLKLSTWAIWLKNRFKTIHQSQKPSKNVVNHPTASTTVQPRNTVRQQQPTTSFICMTIQAHTVLQKLCLGIKITTQGNYVTLIIICHEHQNKLKYILWTVYW